MDDNSNPSMGEHCDHCHSHGCCGHGHYHGHFFLRWLLGLLILAIVFALGVKIGEFKAGNYGYSGNFGMSRHMRGNYFYTQPPMMYWGGMPTPVSPMMNTGTTTVPMMKIQSGTSQQK